MEHINRIYIAIDLKSFKNAYDFTKQMIKDVLQTWRVGKGIC